MAPLPQVLSASVNKVPVPEPFLASLTVWLPRNGSLSWNTSPDCVVSSATVPLYWLTPVPSTCMTRSSLISTLPVVASV